MQMQLSGLVSAFCRWQNINNFQIECRPPKCVGWKVPLPQFVTIFLLEDVAFLF